LTVNRGFRFLTELGRCATDVAEHFASFAVGHIAFKNSSPPKELA
jgi:hypothetical protein